MVAQRARAANAQAILILVRRRPLPHLGGRPLLGARGMWSKTLPLLRDTGPAEFRAQDRAAKASGAEVHAKMRIAARLRRGRAGGILARMERRVGFIGILIEDPGRCAAEVNRTISDFAALVLARVGLPPRDGRSDAVVTLVVEASTDELGAFTGRLGRIPGVSVKSALGRKREA